MAHQYQVVALLPMKAHSARVAGKNFRSFAGQPLFSWILKSLLGVDRIERIVINTDAREILEKYDIVHHPRVLIRDRPPEICGDFVSMNRVIENDLQNVDAATYLMTHTTNPLLSSESIADILSTYESEVAKGLNDSLFTVNKYQTRFYRADGSPINHDPQNLIRTQDLEPWFEENSNLYAFSRESFAATKARIGAKPYLYETARIESFDIDDQVGWELAEMIALQIHDRQARLFRRDPELSSRVAKQQLEIHMSE